MALCRPLHRPQAAIRDQALAPAERDALARRYADRAVALLTRARDRDVARWPVVVPYVADNPAFAPLRDRADYQALMASGRPGPPEPK